jgi:hypothetical protein
MLELIKKQIGSDGLPALLASVGIEKTARTQVLIIRADETGIAYRAKSGAEWSKAVVARPWSRIAWINIGDYEEATPGAWIDSLVG